MVNEMVLTSLWLVLLA